MTKDFLEDELDIGFTINSRVKDVVKWCLGRIGKPVKFDWQNGAPSYVSYHFGDKPVDFFVTKIWPGKGKLKGMVLVNIHNPHSGESFEKVGIADNDWIDWGSILARLIPKIGECPITKHLQALVNRHSTVRQELKDVVKECLVQIGKPVEFGTPGFYVPSYEFFSRGGRYVYPVNVKKIWIDEAGNIATNLQDCYTNEEVDNVVAADSDWVYWWDILYALGGELD